VAITTVAGNQSLDKTTLNARRMCSVAGISGVPIAAGCDRPLVRDRIASPEIHGESGLDGPAFGVPTVAVDARHAVDLIIEMSRAHDGLVLVPTGPLTNVATALARDPGLARRLRRIVLMGGAIGLGNVTPAAEFNIAADPEAARAAFESGFRSHASRRRIRPSPRLRIKRTPSSTFRWRTSASSCSASSRRPTCASSGSKRRPSTIPARSRG
jgi:inosine-uridine nucleoside N-ribohydrolase